MTEPIYLDYNASAPLRPEVRDIVLATMKAPHNASSVHRFGRHGRLAIEKAREQVAALVNAPTTQVIFNSGATEANNTVLKHFARENILVSAIEHPSVLEAADDLIQIPVDSNGLVDLEQLEALLKDKKPALVSVMLVNNETGVIQPIKEISALAKGNGALVHCDAVQAAGRIPIDIQEMGIDFLSLSAHKIGGPQGVGALVLGLCGITPTLLLGGGQEKSARAGTENVAGITGFGEAAKLALEGLEKFQKLTVLRDQLESDLIALAPETVIHAQEAPRVANTSMFSLPGVNSETLLMALDLEQIAVSNGSACSSGTVKASHVLQAMGLSDEIATSALRISLGWATKEADLAAFLDAWSNIYNRVQDKVKAHA